MGYIETIEIQIKRLFSQRIIRTMTIIMKKIKGSVMSACMLPTISSQGRAVMTLFNMNGFDSYNMYPGRDIRQRKPISKKKKYG